MTFDARPLKLDTLGFDLSLTPLPGASGIKLWLLDAALAERPLAPELARRLRDGPPFWSVCWAAGLVLADYFTANSALVRAKTVLDFGAGSGVVGIAAALAGAAQVYTVDCDPLALEACRVNAALNGVTLVACASLAEVPDKVDWITAADLFYDAANLALISQLRAKGAEFLVAEARCQALETHGLQRVKTVRATTVPAFHDPQFETVSVFR